MASSTSPVPQVVEGANAVRKVNEIFDAASNPMLGGRDASTTALLVWGYLGGRFNGITVASGTVTLTASNTNYVVLKRSDGVVSVSTATTNWNNTADYCRLYSVVVGTTAPTSYVDERLGYAGLFQFSIGTGTDTYVLTMVSGVPTWAVSASGFSNPMTTAGDIIVGGASGVAQRLAKGTAYQGLRMNSGATAAEWATHTIAIPIACSDESTALTTGTAKVTFRMPHAMVLTAVRASLTTAQASGSIFTVDINEGGTTILSTKLTIDNTENTSTTAATPPVISDASLADDAEITIDIDQIGTSGAAGLKVYLIGYVAQ